MSWREIGLITHAAPYTSRPCDLFIDSCPLRQHRLAKMGATMRSATAREPRQECSLGTHYEKAPHCPARGLTHAPTGLVSPVIAGLECIMHIKCPYGCGMVHACIWQGLWSMGTERQFCPWRRHGLMSPRGPTTPVQGHASHTT